MIKVIIAIIKYCIRRTEANNLIQREFDEQGKLMESVTEQWEKLKDMDPNDEHYADQMIITQFGTGVVSDQGELVRELMDAYKAEYNLEE